MAKKAERKTTYTRLDRAAKHGDGRANIVLSFRVCLETKRRVEDESGAVGYSVSEWLKVVIEDEIAKIDQRRLDDGPDAE